MPQAQLFTPANFVTASRLVLGPLCIWLLTSGGPGALWVAFALVLLGEASDLVDGYVARASARVSNFGKILDPMADCLYRGSVFIGFVMNGWMPVWMLAIILWRDLAVSYLREIAELRSETLAARVSGKWKAIVQGIAQVTIVGCAAWFGKENFEVYGDVVSALLILATAVTAYSLYDYAAGVLKLLRQA
jgi:CDP-diacylglycerol---glycerol-3-phosphate 3-phosphatidyltransferase